MCFSIYKKKKKFDDAVELRCVRRHSMSSATLCISSHYVRRHKRFAFYIILCPSLRRNNYLHYDRCYIIPDNTSDQNVVTICLPLWITRHLLKKITFFFKCRHSFLLKNMTISHCFSHSLSVFLNMNSIRRNHYSYEETKRQFTCTVNVNLLCFLTVVKI